MEMDEIYDKSEQDKMNWYCYIMATAKRKKAGKFKENRKF